MSTAVTGTSRDDWPDRPRTRRVSLPSNHDRWVGSSLARAMRRAQLTGIVLVQLVLLIAALVSTLAVRTITALLVAGVVVIAAFVVMLLRAHVWVLIVTYYLALGFYYVVAVESNDPLLGALIPLTAWTVILPVMLWPGVRPIILSVLLAAIYPTLLLLAHPGWDRSVLSASLITNGILIVNAVVFVSVLRRIAESLDQQNKAEIEEEAHAARQAASQHAAAEYVRVLHDTIVNTFGALARKQLHGTNATEIRQRCRRDLERIRTFQRGPGAARRERLSLTDLDHVGLPVRWTGLSGDDLRRFQALLPVAVVDALYGCASEAILNATKHSGADHIVVDARYVDDELHVAISDEGRGFDPTGVAERGIAESIFARGKAHGLTIDLDSVVGEGTTVRLSYTLQAPHEASPPSEKPRPLGRFTRKIAIAWALHAVAIGISLEAFNPRSGSAPAYLLLAGLLAFAASSWITSRKGRPPPGWLITLMHIAIPVANWCALASVGYGNDARYLFQAVSLTVLPVLIYALSQTFAVFLIASGLQVVSMLVIGMSAVGADASRLVDLVLLEAPTAGLLTMWFVLLRKFQSIEFEIAESKAKMERSMRDAAAHEAAAEIQMQWSASGLQGALELLRDIADGAISPHDPETRRRCGEEEIFLRQISALSQTATLMSRWFALALAEARTRQIQLEVQAEQAPVGDADLAAEFGRLMLDSVAASSANSTLNVTLLQREGTLRMLIVGPGDGDLIAHLRNRDSDRLRIAVQRLQGQVIVDAVERLPASTRGRATTSAAAPIQLLRGD